MDLDLADCIDGCKEAWDGFVDRYSGVIAAAVRRAMGQVGRSDRPAIDDAIQETFVRLIKHDYRLLRSYDPSRASLTTWLTIVARSTAIDQLRRRRGAAIPIEHAEPVDTPTAPADLPRIPLQLLSERQRLVISMLFDRSMSVPEAAAVIGVDEQTIRSTKHKALSRLRAYFEQEAGGLAGMREPAEP